MIFEKNLLIKQIITKEVIFYSNFLNKTSDQIWSCKKSQTNHIWNGGSNKQTNLTVLNFKFNYAISHLGCVWLRSEIEWSGSILNFKIGMVPVCVW